MSVRLRLALWYAGVIGLVLILFAVLVYTAINRQLTSQLDYTIHLQALDASRSLHTISLASPEARTQQLPLPIIPEVTGSRLYVQLVDPSGGVLARSSNLRQPLPTMPATRQSLLASEEAHSTISLPDERMELYSTPLHLDDRYVGMLQVAASLRPLEASMAQLRLVLGVVVAGAATVAAALGWFLATKAMRPVDRLTQAARAIGCSTDLSRRLPEPEQHDELGRLAATFNEMLSRLDQAFVTQQRFLADASHELRTPLAAIRTNVSTLLRGTGIAPGVQAEILQATVREADRMGRLVADLLVLARADAGQPLGRRRLELDRLLLEVYQQAKALARGVRLALDDLEQVEVDGDPDRLRQLLLNLMDNAVRYTPAGGTVCLGLVHRNGWAVITVRDTGVGIAAEHLPRIFDRFYRVEQPQLRGASGTGLGLAICRWIAEAHGGRIVVTSQVEQGSTFTVSIPADVGMSPVHTEMPA